MSLRIVWHGNSPTVNSGYGKMTALFAPRIVGLGHEIAAISSPYSHSGCPVTWNDIPVLGCARDSAGNDILPQNHEYFKADLTITLADPFGLKGCASIMEDINVAMWFPVDCSPLGIGDAAVLRDSRATPIAMSRFGWNILTNEGVEPLYVPHGVDTEIYSPGDPMPYRDAVPGITEDTFVIGMVAMNRDPVRKGFPEQLLAFSVFHARHPNSFLVIHSSTGGGLNLAAIATQLGISTAVSFPDTYSYELSLITEEQLAGFYRGLDVLSMCSYGEGFGLPLIEAQACGIPVITTEFSATAELCGAGWSVTGTSWWSNGHQSWWLRPDVEDIVNAYEMAWQAREQGNLPKKQAREFAMQYDADRVTELYWKPCLTQLEESIR